MAGFARDRIMARLWPAVPKPSVGVWAVLDGARDDQIFSGVRDSGLDYACLYSGNVPRELRVVAPYLVELDPENPITGRLLELAWGNSWGIFMQVPDASRLRHHLKGFLRVRSESGQKLIFRYYDPRVLRAYLPTCNAVELRAIFGPVRRYLLEADNPADIIEYTFDGTRLDIRQSAL